MDGVLVIYWNRTTESQSTRRTNERRRLLLNNQICCSFQVLIIREIARLCELCVSAVINRSLIIKLMFANWLVVFVRFVVKIVNHRG
jgi:hypothetical protein